MKAAWVQACVVAEAIGVTAAATAARLGTWLGDVRGVPAGWLLAVTVGDGLVEGGALGWLQARTFRPAVGAAAARRWALATLAVAGVGWAAASAPATLSGSDEGSTPPLALVLVGAAALGAVMGAVLGVAQSLAVRGATGRPWQWTGRSTVGWTATMPVVFLGATAPAAGWPTSLVVLIGAVTGAAAGAVLGMVTAAGALALIRETTLSAGGHPTHAPAGAEGPTGPGASGRVGSTSHGRTLKA